MRSSSSFPRIVLALAVAFGAASASLPCAHAQSAKDLARARTLDQQGARAYAEGRYADAIRYFEEAYRLGAPPIELWNIAKCYDKIDQPERAAEVLERYLATKDLPKSDRDEAQRMLDGLKKRSSSLTVTSSPDGANVVLDGKALPGRTPLTTTVPPGRYEVTISRPGYTPYGTTFEAKFGRAVIVDVTMKPEGKGEPSAAPPGPSSSGQASAGTAAGASSSDRDRGRSGELLGSEATPEGSVSLKALLGLQIVRHGEVNGGSAPAIGALATYHIGTAGRARIALGGMLHVTFDSWRNSSGRPESAAPCGTLGDANDGVAVTGYGIAQATWKLGSAVSAGPIAGLGLAGYVAGQVGGDVFQPACDARTGILPAFLAGGEVDWRLAPKFKLAFFPLLVHVQPAFDGARVMPRDASGVWIRATFAVGGAFDL